MSRKRKALRISLLVVAGVALLVTIWPQSFANPVAGMNSGSYNHASFWAYPWGKSVTHKGVDVFANRGTPVMSSTPGIVLYAGSVKRGGKVALVLGANWRLHYFAHLDAISARPLSWVSGGERIGSVGSTGNAAGKPPHLHYSIVTLLPYVWRADGSRQGWKKIFYLNPIEYFE